MGVNTKYSHVKASDLTLSGFLLVVFTGGVMTWVILKLPVPEGFSDTSIAKPMGLLIAISIGLPLFTCGAWLLQRIGGRILRRKGETKYLTIFSGTLITIGGVLLGVFFPLMTLMAGWKRDAIIASFGAACGGFMLFFWGLWTTMQAINTVRKERELLGEDGVLNDPAS